MSSQPQSAQLSKYLKLCKLIIRPKSSRLLLYKQREGGSRAASELSEQATVTPERLRLMINNLPPHESERESDFVSLTAGTQQ